MRRLLVVGACLVLGACATVVRDWEAVGGSRSDGVIRLTMQRHELEQVLPNEAQAAALAREKCAAWGYSGAEPFGATSRRCEALGGFTGCRVTALLREYQCIGSGRAPAEPKTP
jgi:hypothetical protein